MNRRLFFIGVIFLVLTMSSRSYAQSSRIYISGYMGLNTYNDNEFSDKITPVSGDVEYKNAISLAGALGLRLTRRFRVEGEISYRKSDFDNMDIPAGTFKLGGQLRTWIALLNGYYDFDLGWRSLYPFLSAGLGIGWHNAEIDDLSGVAADASDDDFGFAWQAGGGMKLRMSDDMAFTGSYRYLATSNIVFDNYDLEFDSHELRVGLEYDLPVSSR